ncbi:MAG: hypothetical protein JWQ09_5830 [Segetibacter sp.]|nr:hypothetical protein [Segetibacter sp.]
MKPLLTTRVTAIESFRMFLYGQTEANERYINEANVIGTIKGEERFNIKADYGTSGHCIIESPARYKTNTGYQVDDFIFSDTQAIPMLNFRTDHPLMTREIALTKLYHTRHFDLVITGTCDHLEGLHVRDTKFKFSSFDVADFMSSIQWKLYLDMIGLDTFFFDFFSVSGFDKMEDMAKSRIAECESMPLRRYAGMDTDIQSVLEEFAEFVVFKGLESYLTITDKKYKRILKGDNSLKNLIQLKLNFQQTK